MTTLSALIAVVEAAQWTVRMHEVGETLDFGPLWEALDALPAGWRQMLEGATADATARAERAERLLDGWMGIACRCGDPLKAHHSVAGWCGEDACGCRAFHIGDADTIAAARAAVEAK